MAARVNFLPLLWSHSPWCSVLVLSPVLFVGHPLASVPLPDQNGWEPLLRGEGGIWQTQVGCARGVCSSRSPISCYSLGSVMHSPRGIGPRARIPWQYPAEQAPRKVWAVTCSCWQFDGSCDGHHTHLWGWRLQPHLAPPLTLVKVLSCCLRVHRVRGSPRQWSLSLWQAQGFSWIPQLCYTGPLRLSSWQSTPFFSLESLNLSTQWPQTPVGMQASISGWGVLVGIDLCAEISPICLPHTCCCTLLWGSEVPTRSPHPWDIYKCAETFLPSELLPWGTGSFVIPLSPSLSHFFPIIPVALSHYVEISLMFWKSEVFCQHSVGVL